MWSIGSFTANRPQSHDSKDLCYDSCRTSKGSINAMKSRFPASWQVIGRSVVDWWDSWLDLLGVIIVWLLAQLTIVLGPPATFGLYYVVYHLVNGESIGIRGIIEGGRKYFVQSWLWNVINLLVLIVLYVNLQFYNQFEAGWRFIVQAVMVILGALWITGQFYALAFFNEQKEARIFMAIRNGIFMALATPFFSFILMTFTALLVSLCAILVLPIFMGIPAIIPIMGARAVQNRLVAFGIRERDKTPKELEREESSRVKFPGTREITDGERQVQK
jgi:uncharacterized membrane protein YesL